MTERSSMGLEIVKPRESAFAAADASALDAAQAGARAAAVLGLGDARRDGLRIYLLGRAL
jgi:hypothetical protein